MNEIELFRTDVPEQCTPEQARDLTDRIKFSLDGMWELVRAAYISRAWAALGYLTWDEYCTREFGTSHIRLPREERGEVIGSLRDSGLSLRAIAAATGLSRGTVGNELAGSGVQNWTPEVEVTREPAPPDPVERPRQETPPAVATPAAVRPVTKGLDGKTYQPSRPARAPAPSPPADLPPPLFTPPEAGPASDAAREALSAFVGSDPAIRLAAWRTSFMAAIGRMASITEFKPDDVAVKADQQLIDELQAAHRHLGNYIDRINAQRPSGLRLVQKG